MFDKSTTTFINRRRHLYIDGDIYISTTTFINRRRHLYYIDGDIYISTTTFIYNLLYGLEDDDFLDPLNDTDLFCVHYAILPQVNRCLEEFTESWNHHSLSSAGNLTPEALFTIGLLEKQQNESAGEHCLPTEGDLSSVSLLPHGMEDVSVVDVPSTPAQLCPTMEQNLSRIPIDTAASDFGLSRYMESIEALGSHIQNGCNACLL